MQTRPPAMSPAFTLIEMAIVLVVIGIAMTMVLSTGSAMLDSQKRQTVRARLDAIDTAMANFVAVNKRLPCPADGRIVSGAATAGVELVSAGPNPAAGSCNPLTQLHGVVPWVTLGLTENDTTDPWFARLTYRVDPPLAAAAPQPPLMNMSHCDPSSTGVVGAGGICRVPTLPCTGNANCTSPANFLAGKGLDVWDGLNGAAGWTARQNNSTTGKGAAYVVISHGPSGAGAYNGKIDTLQPGTVPLGKDLEEQNANGQVLAKPATQANTYRDAPLNDNEKLFVVMPPVMPAPPARTESHFDDYLSHPTIMTVLNRAQLGPRAQ